MELWIPLNTEFKISFNVWNTPASRSARPAGCCPLATCPEVGRNGETSTSRGICPGSFDETTLPAALDGELRQDGVVVYDKSNGHLSFAVDSNKLVDFASVSANTDLKSTDFWVV